MSRFLSCAKCKGFTGSENPCIGCNINFHKGCMKKVEACDVSVTSLKFYIVRCEKCAEIYQQRLALAKKLKNEAHDAACRVLDTIAVKAEFLLSIEIPVVHTESFLKFKEVLLKIEDLLEG